MITSDFIVTNTYGLHARPCTLFAKAAGRYASSIRIKNGGGFVDGKSIMDLLCVGAEKGTLLTVIAKGPDAGEAMREIKSLFDSSFGEK
jgi:phosphotransferase system HPr (HPr) family protein